MIPSFRFHAVGLTHEGLVRQVNEDSHLIRSQEGLWAVADGMGGHENGQWASSTVISALEKTSIRQEFEHDLEVICGAVHDVNDFICTQVEETSVRMGSTLAALLIRDGRFGCIWAGDSRIYLLRGDRLIQLTRDHTQVQDMLDQGLVSVEDAAHHPMSNVLSGGVGVETELRLDAVVDSARPRDLFLLCSDGLSHVISDHEIEERLLSHEPGAACQRMLELVLSRGAPDNVTMIAVVCEEATALVLGASLP